MTTTTTTVHYNLLARDKDSALFAAHGFSDTLNTVWVVRSGVSLVRVAGDVWSGRVRVTAPAHELHADAPIIRDAVAAAGVPVDSIRVD